MDALKKIKEASALAVVGVSLNREKYPYKIWKFLRNHGKKAYPVNPKVSEVDGERCYSSINELPEAVEAVIAVVSPHITETLPNLCKEMGVAILWMQPGAESVGAEEACHALGILPVTGRCVMAEW